jgi:hypothetical protein
MPACCTFAEGRAAVLGSQTAPTAYARSWHVNADVNMMPSLFEPAYHRHVPKDCSNRTTRTVHYRVWRCRVRGCAVQIGTLPHICISCPINPHIADRRPGVWSGLLLFPS